MAGAVSKKSDIVGKKINMLLVIRFHESRKAQGSLARFFECLCDCGKSCYIRGVDIRSGNRKSCGCLRPQAAARTGKQTAKHGMYSKENTKYRRIWNFMISRCENKNDKAFARYGAKGITVCDRWKDFWVFMKDIKNLEDSLGVKIKRGEYTMDRTNNSLGYSPENVTLSTPLQQRRNTDKSVMINGITAKELSDETGISYTVVWRLMKKSGKSPDEIRSLKQRVHHKYLADGKKITLDEIAKKCETTEDTLRWKIRTLGFRDAIKSFGVDNDSLKFTEELVGYHLRKKERASDH